MHNYKKLKCFLALFTAFLSFAALSSAQGIVGRVVDQETGKPIAGASVYLNGTYKGTSSDSTGKFYIATNETRIPLIISYVGYETLTVDDYVDKQLTVNLRHKPNMLREVSIGFDGLTREQKMKIFLDDFIGTSNRQCTISNPDDISFIYHKKTQTLIAEADQPLTIYNKKFGYKITYFLTLFKHVPGGLTFQGNYFFAEDTAKAKPKDVKKMLKLRGDAYYGSRMHFIRSLWANTLKDNKFHVWLADTSALYSDLVTVHNDGKYLKYHPFIRINYRMQSSFVRQTEKDWDTLISANGFHDPRVLWGGDISDQRVGELLPFEFEPLPKQ